MAGNLLFKGFPWEVEQEVGFWGCLTFKTLLTLQPLFLQEHSHPRENKDGMNNHLGFIQHPRKGIKHNRLCSVLPKCELLILCSSGPCPHRDIRRSSGATPHVHEPFQHEPVPPPSTHNPTDSAQPAGDGTTRVWVKRKPLPNQDTLKTLTPLRKKEKIKA